MGPDRPPPPDLGRSIEIMRAAHEGQIDKSGRPYWLHPLRVAMRLMQCSPAERHAALLHDVVEDTPVTMQDLRDMGYPEEVMELVDLLTRRKPAGESHTQYIDRLVRSRDAKALRVKLADVYDNMSPARTTSLPREARGMRHRFERDAERVLEALRGLGDELHETIPRGDL
jgi:(p)ppGpp synthase/HD superfamily hydrolase